ncbi:MAG: type III pantothenate kinase [Halioglobus sp.]
MKLAAACLQLDVGNSGAKWRLLRGAEVVARGKCIAADESSRQALLACTAELEQIWISSVAAPAAESDLLALLESHWDVVPWMARTEARTGDLVNSYDDPTRMGVDRWLVMLAARQHVAGKLCVVDAGSALTIDIVSASGRHEGGYIIPGPALMERALLLDTDRVRFAEDVEYQLTPGTSTAQAVRHGIALAQAGAVALALDHHSGEPMQVLFCGGGGELLMSLLDRGGKYLPDLVFEGLQEMALLSA